MKRQLMFFFHIIATMLLLTSCRRESVIRRHSTLFGEKTPNPNEILRIHFDRLGYLYPDNSISNEIIKANNSSIKGLAFSQNQDSIFRKTAEKINLKLRSNNIDNVTFILVGYNNKYEASTEKLEILHTKINNYLKNVSKKTLVVELYWDTMAQLIPLRIFNLAKLNSYYAGFATRKLMNEILNKYPKVHFNFISHSLGANVVCNAIFNQETDFNRQFEIDNGIKKDNKTTFRAKDLIANNQLITKSDSITKDNRIILTDEPINAAIIAPAIGGINTFNDYFSSKINQKNAHNHNFIIGFNKNDRVLRKFLDTPILIFNRKCGYLTKVVLGSTALGACQDEVDAVRQIFKENMRADNFKTIDFSKKKGKKKHGIQSYMNDKHYEDVFDKVFNKN